MNKLAMLILLFAFLLSGCVKQQAEEHLKVPVEEPKPIEQEAGLESVSKNTADASPKPAPAAVAAPQLTAGKAHSTVNIQKKSVKTPSGVPSLQKNSFTKPIAKLSIISEQLEGKGYSYNQEIYLDTAGSKLEGGLAWWEIYNGQGVMLKDPSYPGKSFQLKSANMPWSLPTEHVLIAPSPGKYRVKYIVKNNIAESSAEVQLNAINTPPEAVPGILAGPNPPGMIENGKKKVTAGLNVVAVGETVYLQGWGVDGNFMSPELYNPGGHNPDLYGKNNTYEQLQFGWNWTLQYKPESSSKYIEVSNLLQGSIPETEGRNSQYPFFVANEPGTFLAWLTVNDNDPVKPLKSLPAPVKIIVLQDGFVGREECQGCHSNETAGWAKTSHGLNGSPSCEDCHGPGKLHINASHEEKAETIAVSYQAGLCGQCHAEFGEWEKARHSDGYAFGYKEIAEPLLLNCAKCHYPKGFAEAIARAKKQGKQFGEIEFKIEEQGKVLFDFSQLPVKNGEGVTCQACHSPHGGSKLHLRVESKSQSCGTCHEEKWQNVLLEGNAGKMFSAYEYPAEDYLTANPHLTPEKCTVCHMNTLVEAKDGSGIRKVGGHTLRMREAGPNGSLGGFGPRADEPGLLRDPGDTDDLLNTQSCQPCHEDLADFNYRGVQARIYGKWQELGEMLKALNGGTLPGYKPGDKCATCHKGGTLPFKNDPEKVLENAYTNYKLIKNDRSWGIHNVKYIEKLLDDSIKSLQSYKNRG